MEYFFAIRDSAPQAATILTLAKASLATADALPSDCKRVRAARFSGSSVEVNLCNLCVDFDDERKDGSENKKQEDDDG